MLQYIITSYEYHTMTDVALTDEHQPFAKLFNVGEEQVVFEVSPLETGSFSIQTHIDLGWTRYTKNIEIQFNESANLESAEQMKYILENIDQERAVRELAEARDSWGEGALLETVNETTNEMDIPPSTWAKLSEHEGRQVLVIKTSVGGDDSDIIHEEADGLADDTAIARVSVSTENGKPTTFVVVDDQNSFFENFSGEDAQWACDTADSDGWEYVVVPPARQAPRKPSGP